MASYVASLVFGIVLMGSAIYLWNIVDQISYWLGATSAIVFLGIGFGIIVYGALGMIITLETK